MLRELLLLSVAISVAALCSDDVMRVECDVPEKPLKIVPREPAPDFKVITVMPARNAVFVM